MFARIVIFCCFFAMIFCAPLRKKFSSSKTKPTSRVTLPNVQLPDFTGDKSKYELLGGGYQGDMIFPKGFNVSSPSNTKGVASFGPHLWPNNIISYDISSIRSIEHRNIILKAMSALMYAVGTPIPGETSRKTCVYFRPKQNRDKRSFKIVYGSGCSATVGYWSNIPSIMTLNNPGCYYTGTIQHELMHILGFYHEQSRPDRDSYITIHYNNVKHGEEYNFAKLQWDRTALNQNKPYDLESIMHYGANFFSANGKPTISVKQSNVVIGQREQLSTIDIAEIRALYGC